MSRKLRVWFPVAKYHITSRGNRRSAIFYDDFDREVYWQYLEEARRNFSFHLHAYCHMTNHIHLQIETIHHHPKDIMKMLNSRYAMYFNKRHRLVGHVFQGSGRYIHLNPVEAKMVKSPKDFRWSSYTAYVDSSITSILTQL